MILSTYLQMDNVTIDQCYNSSTDLNKLSESFYLNESYEILNESFSDLVTKAKELLKKIIAKVKELLHKGKKFIKDIIKKIKNKGKESNKNISNSKSFKPNRLVEECIKKEDIRGLAGALVAIIFSDKKFKSGDFDSTLDYLRRTNKDIYDKLFTQYDKKELYYKKGDCDQKIFRDAVFKLEKNFCRERINDVKKISKELYGAKLSESFDFENLLEAKSISINTNINLKMFDLGFAKVKGLFQKIDAETDKIFQSFTKDTKNKSELAEYIDKYTSVNDYEKEYYELVRLDSSREQDVPEGVINKIDNMSKIYNLCGDFMDKYNQKVLSMVDKLKGINIDESIKSRLINKLMKINSIANKIFSMFNTDCIRSFHIARAYVISA